MDVADIIDGVRRSGRLIVDEPRAKSILAEFGIPVPAGIIVQSASEVATAAAGIKPPFAVKLVSPDAVHKSDLGAVRIGIESTEAAADAVSALALLAGMKNLHVDGYLIEQMAPRGRELVIGGMMDPRFGPVVMTGLGGVFVEIFRDLSFRICPIERDDAEDMLDGLQAAPLLAGARGQAPVAREAVINALLRVGGQDGLLMRLAAHIRELDINPLIASPEGVVAVDARIVLEEGPRD